VWLVFCFFLLFWCGVVFFFFVVVVLFYFYLYLVGGCRVWFFGVGGWSVALGGGVGGWGGVLGFFFGGGGRGAGEQSLWSWGCFLRVWCVVLCVFFFFFFFFFWLVGLAGFVSVFRLFMI